jgi:hypothetical protein
LTHGLKPFGPDFQGAVYEKEVLVSGNRHAEMGLVYLALTCPEFDGDGIDLKDFCWDDCKYLYGEYLRMKESGLPPTDQAALRIWFNKPDVLDRMKAARIDWYDTEGNPMPFVEIFQIVLDGGFASMANLLYYKGEIRKWRVIRGIRYLSYHLREKIDRDDDQYNEAIAWAQEGLDGLKKLASTIRVGSSVVPERVLK